MEERTTLGLSIRQPWVELILQGRKTIEVRSWRTLKRGPLYLHASKKIEKNSCVDNHVEPSSLTTGSIVGMCELYDCIEFTEGTWEELRTAHLVTIPYKPGLFGWFLRNAKRCRPLPYNGSLGFMKIWLKSELVWED